MSIKSIENQISYEKKFQYQMLDRLRTDCEYYLGNGHRNTDALWAGDEKKQIKEMKTRWLEFSETEKPEWMSWEQILAYEKEMCK